MDEADFRMLKGSLAFFATLQQTVRDFRLPPRRKWDLGSSGMLPSYGMTLHV
jgi:hypothetical protein